jgi:hypothetical protein
MATNTFTNALVKGVGTTPVTVYTPPATKKSIVIEVDIANTSFTTGITVDVYITKSAVNYYIGKNLPIPMGGSLQVVSGQKIVLMATDTLTVVSSVAASADIITSILEDI